MIHCVVLCTCLVLSSEINSPFSPWTSRRLWFMNNERSKELLDDSRCNDHDWASSLVICEHKTLQDVHLKIDSKNLLRHVKLWCSRRAMKNCSNEKRSFCEMWTSNFCAMKWQNLCVWFYLLQLCISIIAKGINWNETSHALFRFHLIGKKFIYFSWLCAINHEETALTKSENHVRFYGVWHSKLTIIRFLTRNSSIPDFCLLSFHPVIQWYHPITRY